VRRVALILSALTAAGLMLAACGERSSPGPRAGIPTLPKAGGSLTVTQY